MDQRRLRLEDYTVGWICALPLELEAARAMLDEEHRDPPRQPHETNVYCLGRIREHNVAMICLPAGWYGTNSATASAVQMMEKFRSIRYSLMVGIGGGVPSEEVDIRLGDVVISQPQGQHGGVVQYDLGKIEADGHIVRTGHLSPPPIILLNALSKLRSAGRDQARNILAHISSVVTSHRSLNVEKPESDLLYESTYSHIGGFTCQNCDPDRVKNRGIRQQEIQVHYGTIASGNQVVKDAITRDKLSKELGGVLCFEMEAAGLMNTIPCLVIRGICDYADSHKSKEWQQYAAIMAAACAKELLGMVPPAETFGNPVQKDARACLETLFLTDPYIDRENLISSKGARVAGTCEWICKNELYNSWLQSSAQLLWICGSPGKGKTMLSIFLTEELEKLTQELNNKKLVFYFCSHEDEKRNTAVAILRGLIYQIIKECPQLLKHAEPYFDTEGKAQSTVSSAEGLWVIFKKIVQDTNIDTIFCVLDGLDECDKYSQRWLGTKFSDLFSPNGPRMGTGGFKLIVVSRKIHALSGFPRVQLDPDFDEQVTSDIEHFISVRVQELSGIDGFNDKLHTHVKNVLLKRAEGTFLWVGFVINELLQKETCTEVLDTLHALPKGLPGIYSRMLLRIEQSQQQICSLILRWVTVALRPLTLQELAAAIGTHSSTLISSDQAIRDQIAFCGSFIKIHNQEVGLIHQSVRDYLLREDRDSNPTLEMFRIKTEEAHFEVAQACLNCIENSGLCYMSGLDVLQESPLLRYAARHWPEHARCSSAYIGAIFDMSRPFFQKRSSLRSHWCKTYSYELSRIHNIPLLHIASYFGIAPWVQKLLAQKRWKFKLRKLANKKDSSGCTPLLYGVEEGHEPIVRLLLEHGADVNLKGGDGSTALARAASRGYELIVRLLLEHDADINPEGGDGWTALAEATSRGHEPVVRLLLKHGADINLNSTALHVAVSEGHEPVVRLLLEHGADVNSKSTALRVAASKGHEPVVRLLLEHGADVNSKSIALHVAILNGHTPLVRLLLKHGADINSEWTALHTAASHRHKSVVRLLLKHGADINSKSTALHIAALKGHEPLVRLLLEHGADINSNPPALHTAASKGHEPVVRLLLKHGADVNLKDICGSTALNEAVSRGHEPVVQLLLKHGADINLKGKHGSTVLNEAVLEGREPIVQLLLKHGANVDLKDKDGSTALVKAASRGYESIVQLLLEHGANVNLKDEDGLTALARASLGGYKAIVQLLLEYGTDVNLR